MSLAILLVLVGVVLLIVGIAVEAAKWLLIVGIVLLVVGALYWLFTSMRSRTRTRL